jgi:hypothetical protein
MSNTFTLCNVNLILLFIYVYIVIYHRLQSVVYYHIDHIGNNMTLVMNVNFNIFIMTF